MFTIYAPNHDYIGVSAGVVFERGVGETDSPRLAAWFTAKGYRVEQAQIAHDVDTYPRKPGRPKAARYD